MLLQDRVLIDVARMASRIRFRSAQLLQVYGATIALCDLSEGLRLLKLHVSNATSGSWTRTTLITSSDRNGDGRVFATSSLWTVSGGYCYLDRISNI